MMFNWHIHVINAAAARAQAANRVALPFFDSTLAAEDLGGIPVASMENGVISA